MPVLGRMEMCAGVLITEEACPGGQGLLLDGIGLTVENMRRLARWHGRLIDPALARTSAYDAAAQRLARRKAAQHEAKQQARPATDGVRTWRLGCDQRCSR